MTGIEDRSTGTAEWERHLLQRIAQQDRGAFSKLFELYHPRLFKFVYRLTQSYNTADELVNDILLTVWQSADRFRGESKVSTWIFGIAYRQSLRQLRKRKFNLVPLPKDLAATDDADAAIEREDWVHSGIRKLPAKHQITVLLVYYVGLSCEETAEVTGSPVSTVKTRMFHARRKLKKYLAAAAAPQASTKDEDHAEHG